MAIHVHLALLLLATVPLSAQTNPVPAPSATKAYAPTTDSKAGPKQPTPTVFQADCPRALAGRPSHPRNARANDADIRVSVLAQRR